MAKKTLKSFTTERFQQEVARELGIDLSQSSGQARARREAQTDPQSVPAPKTPDRQA
ncbi:MAG: hypothetical protein M0Z54_11975 [Thermaerobacter sp.]|nr:hypothetical protein [Thermaerobacter sp.]